jgi:hypothetical protein
MLIDFHDIIKILLSNNIDVKGCFHIGAHDCEELVFYDKLGVTPENIVWIDAIQSKVDNR